MVLWLEHPFLLGSQSVPDTPAELKPNGLISTAFFLSTLLKIVESLSAKTAGKYQFQFG